MDRGELVNIGGVILENKGNLSIGLLNGEGKRSMIASA